jgi:hypothetical protein
MTPDEYLKDKKVFFATPCYGGSCGEPYFRSMIELAGTLSKAGIPYIVSTLVNESLVTRARNKLVSEFLKTDATHLFFIDADIRFKTDDALRVILRDKPIVTGTYPMKIFNVDNLVGRKFDSVADVRAAAAKYVTNFVFKDEEAKKNLELQVVDGLIEIHDAGTGFMCIKREVIKRMIEAYPETEYYPEGDDVPSYALFDTIIDEDKRYLSEDYTFCRRWQKLGEKVWLDPTVILDHFGSIVYMGQNLFTFEK